MKRSLRLALVLIAASTCALAAEWGDGVGDRMGLPAPPDGSLEVRVWVGGIWIPWSLYRIRQTADGVVGERYLWLQKRYVSGSADDKLDRKATREYQKLMHQNCGKNLRGSSPDLLWCLVSTNTRTDWAHVLEALPIADLWDLPPQASLGNADCTIFDGVDVRVELLSRNKEHSVLYSNPSECCPSPECRVAAKVLSVVGAIR